MRKRVMLLWLVALTVGLSIWGDILFSRSLPFHGLLMIPVLLAAWQAGRIWGASLALALPIVHAGIILSHPPLAAPLPKIYTGMALHMLTLLLLSELVNRVVTLNRTLAAARELARGRISENAEEYAAQVSEGKILKGMLPICSGCKDIRDDQGYWKRIENYIHDHSEVEFSHGICPDCAARMYPEFAERLAKSLNLMPENNVRTAGV